MVSKSNSTESGDASPIVPALPQQLTEETFTAWLHDLFNHSPQAPPKQIVPRTSRSYATEFLIGAGTLFVGGFAWGFITVRRKDAKFMAELAKVGSGNGVV